MSTQTAAQYIEDIARRARNASYDVSVRGSKEKDTALQHMANALRANAAAITEKNSLDVEVARKSGKTEAIIDRLTLNPARINAMAKAIEDIINLPDPVGSGNYAVRRPNGLKINKIRVPLGVVAMIFESRPNVTSDAAALSLKSGNTCILRGGKEAIHSNTAIAACLREAVIKAGFPQDTIQLIERTEHEVVDAMLQLNKYIDVVIPRGGESLIRSVTEKSRIPVIFHDKGVCHVFVDESCPRDRAEAIVINAKCQRPSVCNAIESLLIHQAYPYKKELIEALLKSGVEVIADEAMRAIFSDLKPATEEDWFTEYLDYKISVKEVATVEEAIEHINHYGSHHSDAILSEHYGHVQLFLDRVDSATVYANASTRFTDGAEFGLGAEIGISTQKLHARGPMGLESLTCDKWVIYGTGQVRP